jgi:hypothetical protein
VFVRDFLNVERPFGELGPRFASDQAWIETAMTAALLALLGDGTVATRPVRCRCGPARVRSDRVVVPLRSVGGGAIPDVDGDVRVTPLGDARTHVALEGVWQRAGSDVVAEGHAVDALARAFLHRLATAAEDGGADDA